MYDLPILFKIGAKKIKIWQMNVKKYLLRIMKSTPTNQKKINNSLKLNFWPAGNNKEIN